MNQDDYQKKIDEHRQSIGLEDNMAESRRTRRSSYTKKPKKKSKNLLLPSLFFIFILIPVCIFLYVHFFYTPDNVEEASSQGVIQVETKPISNGAEKEEEEEEESVEENSQEAEDENEPSTPKEESTEQATPEVKPEVKTEPKEEEQKVETEQRTHIVKADETLYRIAVNYYKDPNAVEKIKAANGLTSNSISAGQKLILP